MSISAEQLNQLHVHGLYSNLQRLVPLMLSLPEFSSAQLEFNELSRKCQMLVYYGNALFEDELHKKAEVVYIEALKIIKSLAKCKLKSTGKQNEVFSEVEVKFKLFKCYLKMKSYREAMATLESIPSKQRAPKVNMQLGKLYQKHGMERSAITCFKEVLRFSSVALEAVICLVNLGISQREIHSLLSSNSTPPEWLLQYMKGYTYASTNKHCKAVQLYKTIELQTLRDNVPLLASMGRSFYMNGDVQQSMSCFEKVRLRDKLHLEYMDVYAQLLEKEGKKRELEKLAQELTDVSHVKAEPWIVMAYYCSSINQETKAVYFAQKGHILDTTNIQALLLKASLLQSLEKYQESIQHYREAIRLAPNQLEPYEGLVECHISDEKFKEAINIARNALKTIGTTPRTLTLCAQAYLQDFSTQDKGKAMLLKALSTDACHLPAVYLYAELLIRDEEYKEAVENLQKVLERKQTSKLYQLYGDALKGMGDLQKGLEQYSKAIRLDPDNKKLEGAMKMVECISESELDGATMEMNEPRDRSSMEDLETLDSDVQWIE